MLRVDVQGTIIRCCMSWDVL